MNSPKLWIDNESSTNQLYFSSYPSHNKSQFTSKLKQQKLFRDLKISSREIQVDLIYYFARLRFLDL
ncbi:hypothetical protein LguiB_013096 [Lonicera macranthoides]